MESPCVIRFPDGQRLDGIVTSHTTIGNEATLEVMVNGTARTDGQCLLDFPGLQPGVKLECLWTHRGVSKFRIAAFMEK